MTVVMKVDTLKGRAQIVAHRLSEVAMAGISAKEEARRLIDQLPDEATWEDIEYQIYVRQRIEQGLRDSREGRTIPHEEIRRRFGLPEE